MSGLLRSVSAVEERLGRQPARILTIRLGAVGDVLTTLPAIRALHEKFPNASLHHLVDESAAGIISGLTIIERTIVAPCQRLSAELKRGRLTTLLALRRTLREARYDLVVDFESLACSGILASFCHAPTRIGRARWRQLNPLFFNFRVPSDPQDNVVTQHLALLRPVLRPGELPVEMPQSPPLDVGAAERALADLSINKPFVIVAPGSRRPHRALPEKLLTDIVARLMADGEPVLVIGGMFETALAELCARIGVPYSGNLSLPALAGVIARARAFIGADSAPMHIADMLRVPSVVIFGPSSPELYGPMFAPHRSLRDPRFAGRQYLRGQVDEPWFERVDATEVLHALQSLLARAA